jgi:hypothetical protein
VKALLQEYDQPLTLDFDFESSDRSGRWSVDLLAVVSVGGLANAAALDRACAGNRIKTAVAEMRTSIVKGMKFTVIATDYQHAQGQSAAFQSQSSAWLFKLRCPAQVDCDLAVAETPALLVDWFGSRRQAEYALDEAAIQEFDGHEASEVSIFKSGYFGKGLNQTG